MRAPDCIKKNLGEQETIFVFPSEITARFWLKKSFQYTGGKTLPVNRFISWDRFKETAVKYSNVSRPVNKAIRTLFAGNLLEENRENKIFKRIINPDFAENSLRFLKSFVKILPTLHRLEHLHLIREADSREKLEDLQVLKRRYAAFLKSAGLFEPNFEQPYLKTGDERFILFFPEVIEDYSGFKHLLEAAPEIRVIPEEPDHAPTPSLTVFENSILEIKWALLKMGELLDEKVDPENIALTVPELHRLESYLSREAELYEIPLRIHCGKTITAYPETRLFGQIGECVESGFNLEISKACLFNYAVPWKERRLSRKLIRLGIDYKIINDGQWEPAIRKAEKYGSYPGFSFKDISLFYKKLKNSFLEIYNAPGFKELKSSLIDFTNTFLDTSRFEAERLKIFQFALKTLDELTEAFKTGLTVKLPYLLWLDYLDEKNYVKRESSPGIPVYPYRVSSGIYPDYHFIINASQHGTTQVIKQFPFLSIHEEDQLSEAELDLSPHHIRLGALSGSRVHFSYSRLGFEGTCLPPAYFVMRGRIEPFSIDEESEAQDLYESERRFWSLASSPLAPTAGSQSRTPAGSPLRKLFPVQKEGFDWARQSILRRKKPDYTREPIRDKGLIGELLNKLMKEDAELHITPTALELFEDCPFHFLFERGLGLEEEAYRPAMLEPREFGEIMHGIFQDFYEKIKESGKSLEPEELANYQKMMSRSVDAVFRLFEEHRPVPIRPLWEDLRRQANELAFTQLDLEMKEIPAGTVMFTENTLVHHLAEPGIRLTGKIDRISKTDGGHILIDYKKKLVPRREDLFGEEPVSFQMPFYIFLMNENRLEVAIAAYYSIEKRRFIFVLGPEKDAMVSADRVKESIERLKEKILKMAGSVREGFYQVPGPVERKKCPFCPFRGLCRSKYNLR